MSQHPRSTPAAPFPARPGDGRGRRTASGGGIVIAGGGLAAQRCAEALRRGGFEGRIAMVCAEPRLPYDRPPLSKDVLATADAEWRLPFRDERWYADNEVELLLGIEARELMPHDRELRLSGGRALRYERLLIATGSRPRTLSLPAAYENVTTLATLADARRVRAALRPGARIVIVGAGFIGQEVASAARAAGAEAVLVEAAATPLAQVLGPQIGAWLARLHREEAVELLLGAQVVGVNARGGRVTGVVLDDGRTPACDHVVVGIGSTPNTEWLQGCGLGRAHVATDEGAGTRLPGVYAAGDAAATFSPALGRAVPSSHWEAAGRAGLAAARSMLGREPRPAPPASFWSDLYGTRIQYLGHAPLADRVTVDGDPTARRFTATYTRKGAVVACLLVGCPERLPQAREQLGSQPAPA